MQWISLEIKLKKCHCTGLNPKPYAGAYYISGANTNNNRKYGDPDNWLPQLSFVEPADQVAMFSFLDPNVVVRGIHIIPGFAYGLAETGEQPKDNNNMDYFLYYVNIRVIEYTFYICFKCTCNFADNDMFMRYCGGGMGHQAIWEATNLFLKDRPHEELDIRRDEAQDKSEAGKEGEGEQNHHQAQHQAILKIFQVGIKL